MAPATACARTAWPVCPGYRKLFPVAGKLVRPTHGRPVHVCTRRTRKAGFGYTTRGKHRIDSLSAQQSDEENAASSEEYEAYQVAYKTAMRLKAAEIKKRLTRIAIPTEAVIEKEELASRLAVALVAASEGTVRMPMRFCQSEYFGRKSGRAFLAVPLDVGDHGFHNFVIDTKIQKAFVTPALRDKFGIPDAQDALEAHMRETGEYALELISMPEIRLGSTVVNGMSEALVNKEMSRFIGDGVDGMVGYDFLRDYDIQMDFEKKAINFYPGGSLDVGAVYGLEDMTCVQGKEIIAGMTGLPVVLNGKVEVTAVVDFACLDSVINWHAAEAAGVSRDSDQVEPAAYQAVADENGNTLPLSMAAFDIALGEAGGERLQAGARRLHIGDHPYFKNFRMDSGPAMIIGMNILGQSQMVMSLMNRRFCLPISMGQIEKGEGEAKE